jgi:hypothetical protein
LISAIGAIRAAPKMPMRSGAPCPDTKLTLALEGPPAAVATGVTDGQRRAQAGARSGLTPTPMK